MKPEERQALQQNELEQEYVGHLKPFLEKYGRLVALVGVALVLLFVAVNVYIGYAWSGREAGWAALAEARAAGDAGAYENVAELEAGSNAEVWAHIGAGKEFLAGASGSRFTDRASADAGLASARKHFEAALAMDGAPPAARAQALFGLANVEEADSKGEIAAAKTRYEQLKTEFPTSALIPAAELRLEVLERSTTGPFLAWLDTQSPEQTDLARPLDGAPSGLDADAPIPGFDAPAVAPSSNPPAALVPDVPAPEAPMTEGETPPADPVPADAETGDAPAEAAPAAEPTEIAPVEAATGASSDPAMPADTAPDDTVPDDAAPADETTPPADGGE